MSFEKVATRFKNLIIFFYAAILSVSCAYSAWWHLIYILLSYV